MCHAVQIKWSESEWVVNYCIPDWGYVKIAVVNFLDVLPFHIPSSNFTHRHGIELGFNIPVINSGFPIWGFSINGGSH